jgi:outer membrane protein assembly factor BamB
MVAVVVVAHIFMVAPIDEVMRKSVHKVKKPTFSTYGRQSRNLEDSATPLGEIAWPKGIGESRRVKRTRTATKTGAALLLALQLALAVSACGGGSSSSETAQAEKTKPAGEQAAKIDFAAGGSSEAWSLPNADLQNTRSIESGITTENVASLKPAWTVDLKGTGYFGSMSANPVFSPDGRSVYLQDLSNDVFAVNVESGEIEWEYDVPAGASNGLGPNGVTYYKGNLYGETNAAAFALSAKTGEKVWETPNLAEKTGQGFNIQPQVDDGKVFLSTSGQLHGGIAYALDARTGKVLWKFEETKNKEEREVGGEAGTGGAWNAPAIGPKGEVLFGIANPYRSIEQAIEHPTKLLYNDSTVSLNPKTGKLNWYFQAIPNDFQDWDMHISPIYVAGHGRPMVLASGKMGFVYALNPKTGRLLWKTKVGIHNGHDNDSQLALEGNFEYPPLPYTFYPGTLGGVETNMAVSEGMVFVPVTNGSSSLTTYQQTIPTFPENGTGELVAIDLKTGKIVWDHTLPSPLYGDATVSNGIVYATEFAGNVMAFEAKTGKELWKAKLPAGSNSPIAITGKYLVVPAGYPLKEGQTAQLVAYKVGYTGEPVKSVLAATGTDHQGGTESVSYRAGKKLTPVRENPAE